MLSASQQLVGGDAKAGTSFLCDDLTELLSELSELLRAAGFGGVEPGFEGLGEAQELQSS